MIRESYIIKLKYSLIAVVLCSLMLTTSSHRQDEGMFPLNYLDEAALQKAGLRLGTADLFSPGKVTLASALVKVGGCTGSFISPEGLIITNHHCVYGSVAGLSNASQNYLENGFVARAKGEELPINMPCRITQSYDDVSARVLDGVSGDMSPADRAALIASNIKKVVEEEKAKTPDLSVEVSEMFVGRSYMLFRYVLITDVRLVYVPPVTIGQFGGDLDNWEWPRHNGDFSIVRAYVGPDGKPAKYSVNNVPYKPARHLKVNANGTKEGDFVFIMGYPGRTFRHESAPYLKFQQEKQLPLIQKFYSWYIRQMRSLSEGDDNKFLAFAGEIQSLENVEKNYRGKMQGLMRTDLVNQKWADEEAMHQVALTGNDAANKNVVPAIREIWQRKTQLADQRFNYLFAVNQSAPFYAAQQIRLSSALLQQAKTDTERAQILSDFSKAMRANYSIIDKRLEVNVLKELLPRIARGRRDKNPINGKTPMDQWIEKTLASDKLFDTSFVGQTLRKNPARLVSYKGAMTSMYDKLSGELISIEKEWAELDLKLKALMPQYLDMKQAFKAGQFIPDANSTLRLTYGYIKRYKPNDAEIHLPYTTLKGVFEKANTAADYRMPSVVADNLRVAEVPAVFKDAETGEVVVAFLYNLDTTGGNSGSPVLDADGQLIGINFDRSFTATINDYAWNDRYSRSIGCDIRYVLYVMKYVGKADHLIREMGLTL